MSWEIIFVFLLLAVAVYFFISERISPDQTSFGIFLVLLLAAALVGEESKLPDTEQLIGVFSNAAPLTIAAMFVISAALESCGILDRLGGLLKRLATLGIVPVMMLMFVGVGAISAFMNNTPVVVILVPVVLSLAREMSLPASKLLIPLSFAAVFGGTCTLVGTSTNILASGIMQRSGQPPLSMFELCWVGLPMLAVGAIYMAFFGIRILPRRDTLTAMLSDEERKEFITTAFVHFDSPLVGKAVKESGLLKGKGVRLLEIIRNEVAVAGDPKDALLQGGDRLVLAARPSGLSHTRSLEGVDIGLESELGIETIAAHEGAIVEGVVAPRSGLIGRSISSINFRQRYRMIVLAIHRRGVNLRRHYEEVPLAFGDTLLMMGTDEAREALRRNDDDILLLDRPPTPAKSMRKKTPIVLAVLAGVVVMASLEILPIVVAALIGAGVLLLTQCVTAKQAYASIDWSILILIYGTLGLGLALETSGGAAFLAEKVVSLSSVVSDQSIRALIVLACLYIISSALTEVMSNNATVVLLIPIAITIGEAMGIDPRPLVIATTLAASASFATPIGYQTNTYVYGVGNYKFSDFVKVGLPLNIVYFIGAMIIIPLVWDF